MHARPAFYQLRYCSDPRTVSFVKSCVRRYGCRSQALECCPWASSMGWQCAHSKILPNLMKQNLYVWVTGSGFLTRPPRSFWYLLKPLEPLPWVKSPCRQQAWSLRLEVIHCSESIQQQWKSIRRLLFALRILNIHSCVPDPSYPQDCGLQQLS